MIMPSLPHPFPAKATSRTPVTVPNASSFVSVFAENTTRFGLSTSEETDAIPVHTQANSTECATSGDGSIRDDGPEKAGAEGDISALAASAPMVVAAPQPDVSVLVPAVSAGVLDAAHLQASTSALDRSSDFKTSLTKQEWSQFPLSPGSKPSLAAMAFGDSPGPLVQIPSGEMRHASVAEPLPLLGGPETRLNQMQAAATVEPVQPPAPKPSLVSNAGQVPDTVPLRNSAALPDEKSQTNIVEKTRVDDSGFWPSALQRTAQSTFGSNVLSAPVEPGHPARPVPDSALTSLATPLQSRFNLEVSTSSDWLVPPNPDSQSATAPTDGVGPLPPFNPHMPESGTGKLEFPATAKNSDKASPLDMAFLPAHGKEVGEVSAIAPSWTGSPWIAPVDLPKSASHESQDTVSQITASMVRVDSFPNEVARFSAQRVSNMAQKGLDTHQAPVAHAIASMDIVRWVHSASDAPLTVHLTPEDLGILRFEVSQTDHGLHIHLDVEQSSTLDLLRRQGDQLLADLRQAGFGDATLSFSGNGSQDSPPAQITPPKDPARQDSAEQDNQTQLARRLSGSGTLDLRL